MLLIFVSAFIPKKNHIKRNKKSSVISGGHKVNKLKYWNKVGERENIEEIFDRGFLKV
jgi:hypothetical protein